jgi:hypothetical protein
MGYYTNFTGEIAITPPLTNAEIAQHPEFTSGDTDVRLRIVEDTTETAEGTLTRRLADAVIPAQEDSYKGYDLIEHLQAVIDAYPGHTFTGRLNCEGEEAGDLWRAVIRDGRAVRVEPRIIWPDDEEG